MKERIAAILAIGGGLILILWVTSPSARTPAPEPLMSGADRELAEQTTQSVTPLAAQIDDQAARLRARLLPAPPKPQPDRNPFRFGDVPRKGTDPRGTSPSSSSGGTAPKAAVEAVVPPAAPALQLPALVAITSDARDGGLFRTAVLSMNDEMKIVKPGQVFDRFIVEAIGPESVRLVDITSAARMTFVIAIR